MAAHDVSHKNIGIIGSGFAGLHLALMLQQQGIAVTLYTDRTAEQMQNGAPAVLARWGHTIERERALGVNLWDDTGSEFHRFNFYVHGPQPLNFNAELETAGSFIDPRLYLSALQAAFIERGGNVRYGSVNAGDLGTLSEDHDLMVVASGRGSLVEMFPRMPEHSPFAQPARHLNIAYFDGITLPDEDAVHFSLSPGNGEIISGMIHSFNGLTPGLFFEAVPGGDFDRLSSHRYADDPEAFNRTVMELLAEHAPHLYAGVDPTRFGVRRPQDVLQGAFAPTVRQGYARLASGKYAVAIGDVHVLNDPLMGQGANTASQSAWTLGELILTHDLFDEEFCKDAEAEVWEYAQYVVNWSTRMLLPPEPHVLNLIGNSSQNPALASAFANTFHHPQRAAVLESAEETQALINAFMAV